MFESLKAAIRSLGYVYGWSSHFCEYWIFQPTWGPSRVARLNYLTGKLKFLDS